MEPFWREDGGDESGGAWDGGGEATGAECGTVNEEEELVGGSAAIDTGIEGDGKNIVGDGGRSNFHLLHRSATDDDTREVNLAIRSEAVLVELPEDGVGTVVLTHRMPMESDEMGSLHIRRELGDHREVAAVSLLRLGLRIGHGGRHGALALPSMPFVENLVAEFATLGIALFPCHNCCVLG